MAGSGSKHTDLYVINGSEVSKGSSSRFSASQRSANYEPLPHNGIGRVRHTRLTEEEVDRRSAGGGGGGSTHGSDGQKRPPDWTGSKEREPTSKSVKVI